MVGKGYNALRQSALDLGSKIAALQGKNSVRDKKISSKLCATFGLPEGFDGPIHAMGVHVDLYDGSKFDPVHYGGTETMIDEFTNFAMHCIPLLKEHFHMESLVMQWALHSFDEVSPSYLGGKEGISMLINVSHNFANSCHYDSLDYGPFIVLWVMDNDAWKSFDQYLVFNNIVQMMDGKDVRHGLLIKIGNGMIISFQGNTL